MCCVLSVACYMLCCVLRVVYYAVCRVVCGFVSCIACCDVCFVVLKPMNHAVC